MSPFLHAAIETFRKQKDMAERAMVQLPHEKLRDALNPYTPGTFGLLTKTFLHPHD